MKIMEEWKYELRGTKLLRWNHRLRDLSPPERALPLGFDGLEAGETWLEANQPGKAARFLSARPGPPVDCWGCDEWTAWLACGDREIAARLAPLVLEAERGWPIDGHDFWPSVLIPYDPAMADEIEASIRDWLNRR